MENVTEDRMLSQLIIGEFLLPPLRIVQVDQTASRVEQCDVKIVTETRYGGGPFRFVVEIKSSSTPRALFAATSQARRAASDLSQGWLPLVFVPFLSPERLRELEDQEVSGVDLCGNGTITVPGRIHVHRTGFANRYPDSRPLNNPFKGRSALVARMLLNQPSWDSIKNLRGAILEAGASLSQSQVSKALQALEEERLVSRNKARGVHLVDPARLLTKLGYAWGSRQKDNPQGVRLGAGRSWAEALSADPKLQWSITGESSVNQYASFAQGGPIRLVVNDQKRALELLQGQLESVASFADLVLLESSEPGFYFDTRKGEQSRTWASPLQTWLELQAGDARQQDVAQVLRRIILGNPKLIANP